MGLFAVAFAALLFIPRFGATFPYYQYELMATGLPSWIWGFGNFDGVHYLRIAKMGYESSQFSQAFFPLYPSLIHLLSIANYQLLTALAISNLFFGGAIYLFYKLLKIDYPHQISLKSLILLLAFPTSFYFGSVYSESLFIFLVIASLLLFRKKQYLAAGFLGALSSSTRILGLMLIPVFIIEIFLQLKNSNFKITREEVIKALMSIFIIPLGLLTYMYYLKVVFYKPFYFLTAQSAFGAERSSYLVLLPQVIFRYIKVFLTVQITSLTFFNALLEFTFTVLPLLILILAYKRIRFSYWIFTLGCLIIPTLTGTFSSMPRYSLMSFLIFPFVAEKLGNSFKWVVAILAVLGAILVSLFTRGYWVA